MAIDRHSAGSAAAISRQRTADPVGSSGREQAIVQEAPTDRVRATALASEQSPLVQAAAEATCQGPEEEEIAQDQAAGAAIVQVLEEGATDLAQARAGAGIDLASAAAIDQGREEAGAAIDLG